DQPPVLTVDPAARDPAAGRRSGHELGRDLVHEVAHLLAADRMALPLRDPVRPLLRLLAYDRAREQLLLHPERQQPLAVRAMEERSAFLRRNPAPALHFEPAAGLQRM